MPRDLDVSYFSLARNIIVKSCDRCLNRRSIRAICLKRRLDEKAHSAERDERVPMVRYIRVSRSVGKSAEFSGRIKRASTRCVALP